MREAKVGNIILTTSGAGMFGSVGQINYSVAKAGLLGMTRSAARELAPHGIVVNAVAPAAATPTTEKIRVGERFKDKYVKSIAMARWAEADEIVSTYVYLASADTSYVTDQAISVDGGRTMVREPPHDVAPRLAARRSGAAKTYTCVQFRRRRSGSR